MTINGDLHVVSPIIPYQDAADRVKVAKVLLKCDNLQPGGSFKIRGLGHSIKQALINNQNLSTIVASSGGNAGLAATIAANSLGLKVMELLIKGRRICSFDNPHLDTIYFNRKWCRGCS